MPNVVPRFMNRNIKRFFIILTALMLLSLVSLSFFLYFFNINDHADWIGKQISRSSGYPISFQSIDHDLYDNRRFSVNGVSVFIDQNEVMQIGKIKVEIKDIDLWARELEIELIEISALNIKLDESRLKALIAQKKDNSAAKTAFVDWQQVRINTLRVVDLNVEVQNVGQKMQLQHANLSTNNLIIMTDNQTQADLLQGSFNLDFAKLKIQKSPQEHLIIKGLQLNSHLTGKNLQANLEAAIEYIELDLLTLPKVLMTASQLELTMDKNQVFVDRLLTHAFNGELRLQAQALVAINLLASPALVVKSVTIASLLIKDMNLLIPPLEGVVGTGEIVQQAEVPVLPIDTLFIKEARSENINVISENAQIPLRVDNLNATVQDFYLVKNSQLMDLHSGINQDALFVLKFALLRWFDSEMTGFSASGSFNPEDPSLQFIEQHFKTP